MLLKKNNFLYLSFIHIIDVVQTPLSETATSIPVPDSQGISEGVTTQGVNNNLPQGDNDNLPFLGNNPSTTTTNVVTEAEGGVSRSPPISNWNPQLTMSYRTDHHMIHRDIYRLLSHATENIVTSHTDKERIPALWRDLLRVSK